VWRLKHRFPLTESDFVVVGFIDNDGRKQGWCVEEVPILGRYADLPCVVEAQHVDLVIIACCVDTPDGREALTYCERSKARIKLLPDMVSYLNTKHGAALLRKVEPHDLIGRGCISHHEGVALDLLTGRIVLVTGAAGSIGSELCRQLAGFPISTLILLDNNESGLHDLHTQLATEFPRLTLVPLLADITAYQTLRTAFREYGPEIIFHAAAYKHVPMLERYPNEALRVNIGGTRNLAELAQQFGVERFVLISTDKAVHPSCVMGATKRACELMLRALSQQPCNPTLFTAVRFGNVLGSRGSVLPTFDQQIDAGGPVTVTDRRMKRFFMSIPEAVNLVIHASCLTTSNDVFLLRMGEAVPIVDLAERMIRLHGLRPYVDIPIKFTGIRLGEKLCEELNTTDEEIHDTVHPGIIRLSDKQPCFDGKVFLEHIDRAQHMYFDDPSAVVEQLAHAEMNATLASHGLNAAAVPLPVQPHRQGVNFQNGQPQRIVGRYRRGPFLQLDSGNSPPTSSAPSV
jgi:FlaA1/EpsC-like NDP-sugar epimerase